MFTVIIKLRRDGKSYTYNDVDWYLPFINEFGEETGHFMVLSRHGRIHNIPHDEVSDIDIRLGKEYVHGFNLNGLGYLY